MNYDIFISFLFFFSLLSDCSLLLVFCFVLPLSTGRDSFLFGAYVLRSSTLLIQTDDRRRSDIFFYSNTNIASIHLGVRKKSFHLEALRIEIMSIIEGARERDSECKCEFIVSGKIIFVFGSLSHLLGSMVFAFNSS